MKMNNTQIDWIFEKYKEFFKFYNDKDEMTDHDWITLVNDARKLSGLTKNNKLAMLLSIAVIDYFDYLETSSQNDNEKVK